MKNYFIPFVITFSGILIFGSCTKDCEIQSPDIYGSWTVLQTDQQGLQYDVELKFNTNNTYDWILLDTATGHTNSHAEFTLSENLMIITLDADCSSVGEYYLTVEADKLALIAKTDGCAPRAAALEWIWKRK
ncbi:MAG: hypothetical protein H8E34_09765 [Bacteroidetes bacterium]|nr:hypothetical protein [Bacteroidota bacterium]MBL6942776.1 hypothetical protein [Bacteroidales bacterium]